MEINDMWDDDMAQFTVPRQSAPPSKPLPVTRADPALAAAQAKVAALRKLVDVHRPEDNPILAAILVVRHKAAADFKDPQHQGLRGSDFDAGLLAAFHAARAALVQS